MSRNYPKFEDLSEENQEVALFFKPVKGCAGCLIGVFRGLLNLMWSILSILGDSWDKREHHDYYEGFWDSQDE